MSNEQRAHDFALMLTNFYLSNPEHSYDEFPYLQPRKDNLVYDPYCLYKHIYQQAAKLFDEDFKE